MRDLLNRRIGVGLQGRLEASPRGRAAISVFLLFTLLSVVVWNLAESELKRRALPAVRPYVLAAGLDQNWGVFSPDPRRQTIELVARVEYVDGRRETFRVPRAGPVVGEYWDYRWRKWEEWTITDAHSHLWRPAAEWFAREASASGAVARVTLVRRWHDLLPPGPGRSRSDWREYEYYELDVAPASGSEESG